MDQTSAEYLRLHGQQIGRLIIGLGIFDDDITSIVSQSLRLNELQENALLRPMNTRAKVELLGRLGRLFLKGDELKLLSKWCDRAKKALDDRNSLIHGAPGHMDGKVYFRSWTGKNKLIGKPEPWPTEKIDGLNEKFLALDAELEKKLLPLFKPTFAPPKPAKKPGSPPALTRTPRKK